VSPFTRVLSHAVIGLMKLMARWPLTLLRALGWVFGHLLYVLAHSRRRVVQTNLALCFPELSQAQRTQLARRTFVCFAQTFLDRSWLWHAPPALLEKRLRLHGARQQRGALLRRLREQKVKQLQQLHVLGRQIHLLRGLEGQRPERAAIDERQPVQR
jgi:lauroyl/myristoyl acyltransferase